MAYIINIWANYNSPNQNWSCTCCRERKRTLPQF